METLIVLAVASNLEVVPGSGASLSEFLWAFGISFCLTVAIGWLMIGRPKFWRKEWWNS